MGYLPQKFAQYESVAQAVCGAFLGGCSVFKAKMASGYDYTVSKPYPVFSMVSLSRDDQRSSENLIFASPDKPDLRFRDALDNDVEIVIIADKVLVYDRPIGNDGLRWNDLQQWWSDTEQIADAAQAKCSLYTRLKVGLPLNSPPQSLLFDAFFEGFRSAVPTLPAPLPEVCLHWDPRIARCWSTRDCRSTRSRVAVASTVARIRDGSKEVVGLDNDIDDSRLQQFVNAKVNRPIQFAYRSVDFRGQTLGLFTIPPQARPFYSPKGFGKVAARTVYVRRGSSTAEASPEEIAKMGESDSAQARVNTVHKLSILIGQDGRYVEAQKHNPGNITKTVLVGKKILETHI